MSEKTWRRKIVASNTDGRIKNLFYIELECGHKATCRRKNAKTVFCGQCYMATNHALLP